MTTLPSTASTMSSLPIDDTSITHSTIDDNSQLGDFDTLMKKNQSIGIDQHYRESICCALECDLRRLDLSSMPKAVENIKAKRLNVLSTCLSDPCDLSSSSFNRQRLLENNIDDDDDEQSHTLLSLTDGMVAGRPFSHCDQRSPRQDEQPIESQPFIVSNQTRNIIVRPQWISRSSESPTSFKACLPSHTTNSNSELDSFPYTPVIMFINKRSGGQQGDKVYRKLLRKLNPRQVFLLENDATITQALDIYSSLPNIRICVFGGDGTVGWILGHLVKAYPLGNNPPVSIYPLGTGNDLSRVLAWGDQYDPKHIFHMLVQIPKAKVVALDRWEVQLEQLNVSTLSSPIQQKRKSGFQISRKIQPLVKHPKFVREKKRVTYENHHELPNTHFINYMSFGLDAAITLDFHDKRTRQPSKFSSPWKNKLMYLNRSCKHMSDFAQANMWNLGSYIRLICDGHDLTDAIRNCHTLVVLNISGYASGTNPWRKSSSTSSTVPYTDQPLTFQRISDSIDDIKMSSVNVFDSLADTHEAIEFTNLNECRIHQTTSSSATTVPPDCFEQQDFSDQKIEVVGLSTTHMATIHIGFGGNRIAQCNQLRIELCSPMTAQMDGEPFYLPASVALNINHAGQVFVLKNQNE
ncbi:unnamed protein product [Rotaria sordida]|uniref:Diacylglycerol kinase n=1 Tax=Rotaria sordida TaxID=392033 RepID=A0A814QY59_9BILA|nr:unnamed protein product [Rotaria sordida]